MGSPKTPEVTPTPVDTTAQAENVKSSKESAEEAAKRKQKFFEGNSTSILGGNLEEELRKNSLKGTLGNSNATLG